MSGPSANWPCLLITISLYKHCKIIHLKNTVYNCISWHICGFIYVDFGPNHGYKYFFIQMLTNLTTFRAPGHIIYKRLPFLGFRRRQFLFILMGRFFDLLHLYMAWSARMCLLFPTLFCYHCYQDNFAYVYIRHYMPLGNNNLMGMFFPSGYLSAIC